MKTFFIAIYLISVSSFYSVKAQDSCKVLIQSLKGSYEGGCKKGLANGKGVAKGNDTYEGSFKKGYPNGFGKYTWNNGSKYVGYWKMGIRSGEGKYTSKENGKDLELNGIWKNDKYIGEKPIPPSITKKNNIDQVSFVKIGEGNTIIIKILQNGLSHTPYDLYMTSSSGSPLNEGSIIGYQNCDFPFKVKITYKSWNSFRSILYDRTIEFTIHQAGRWEIKIDN